MSTCALTLEPPLAKQLTLDEMLECIIQINPELAEPYRQALEHIGDAMAYLIGSELNVLHGSAIFDGTAFGGTCCPFYPASHGQTCPAQLAPYDAQEWDTEPPEQITHHKAPTSSFVQP